MLVNTKIEVVRLLPLQINSDVVIDFSEAIKYYRNEDPSWEVGVSCGVVDQPSRADRREIFEVKSCSTQGCTLCKTSDIFDDSLHDLERRSDFLDDTTLLRYRTLGKDDLDPDQVILLPPRVYGYSLLDRYWYPLNIDNVEDIKTSVDNGFDDLVLPGDHKRIMQALVKHHSRGPRPTSGKSKAVSGFSADLVRGKGRGLIILLHGRIIYSQHQNLLRPGLQIFSRCPRRRENINGRMRGGANQEASVPNHVR